MESLPRNKDVSLNRKFSVYKDKRYKMCNRDKLIILVWVLLQSCIFMYYYFYLFFMNELSNTVHLLGVGFLLAKSSAVVININFMLLFTISNRFITNIVSLSDNGRVKYHLYIISSILFFSTVHVIAHVYNMFIQNTFTNIPFYTGIFLILLFSIISISSIKCIRKRYHTLFSMIHLLYISIVFILIYHTSSCYLRTNSNTCVPTTYVYYVTLPFLLFICERIYREYVGMKYTLMTDIKKCNDYYVIEFYKPFFRFHSGQHVLIKCPDISTFEWHPFTITSSPVEFDKIQIIIKDSGDWTHKFISYLSQNHIYNEKTNVRLSYAMGYKYDYISKYKIIVFIAGGIGITSFVSFLKLLPCYLGHGKKNGLLKKVHLHWICKDVIDFNCFIQDLKNIKLELDSYFLLELTFYITRKKNTMIDSYPLLFDFKFERPNFDNILITLSNQYDDEIYIMSCGHDSMTKEIKHKIKQFNKIKKKFSYHCGKI